MGIANASIVVSTPDLTEHLPVVPERENSKLTLLSVSLGSFPDYQQPSELPDIIYVTPEVLAAAPTTPSFDTPSRTLKDVAVLIYTSGTSGKPKAVSIKNLQFVIVSTPIQYDVDQPPEGGAQIRIFSCLPLFHATCMFTGLLYSTGSSGTFCLARKFSASNFSKSLFDSGATRMLYVGELCRYLLKAPPSPFDRAHACRVAKGNGLQKDVWETFQERFNITEIREFYRSTEGIARFDNFAGGKASVGRVGFEGPIAKYFNSHTYLVRHDPNTEAPYRDPATGFCVLARAGEPGEALGRVGSLDFYHEYLDNPAANKEKLISNVFQDGDLFQRSGDLLVREKDGWIRFMDRSGDSYRWNGENVSAGEVREHISHLPGVQDATVYGVVLEKYATLYYTIPLDYTDSNSDMMDKLERPLLP
jgi:acyl-CoA synthetase (AMP-forming)/AMP-acid ligase II